MEKQKTGAKLKGVVTDFKKYWKEPKETNYVPNREIVAFSGGGVGVKTINSMTTYIQMTATCLLTGSVYGLSPKQLLILFIISNVIGVLKTPFVSWLVDNTHTKIGKFRPYLLWAGIPCVVGVFGVCFLVPINGTAVQKMVLIAVFYNIYAISQQLYNNAYIGLSQVISPSSGERNKIMSISEFISNLGPSLVQLILPIFAALFFGEEGLLDIRAYRILLPAFSIAGFLLGLIVMATTKERVIYTKKTIEKVKFSEGIKLVGGNGDFWIVTASKFFNGLRMGISFLLSWICLYQLLSSSMNGILTTVVSTAFVPGMLLAPLLMKKFGPGKSAFYSYMVNFAAAVLMLLTFKNGVVFFVIALYVFNFGSGPQYIMQTSLTADVLDEIQLNSRERVEGFAQNFQQMFEVLGNIVAQFIFMLIYESYGLVEGADGLTDYGILTEAAVREPIVSWVIIVAIGASLLSALPFLLCKMTNARHNEIISLLKQRQAEGETESENNEPAMNSVNGEI